MYVYVSLYIGLYVGLYNVMHVRTDVDIVLLHSSIIMALSLSIFSFCLFVNIVLFGGNSHRIWANETYALAVEIPPFIIYLITINPK